MENRNYPSNVNLPSNIKQWLDVLQNDFGNQRYLLSTCSQTLAQAHQQAVDLNALSILVPEEMGGTNLDLTAQYYYHKNMAMASDNHLLTVIRKEAIVISASGSSTDTLVETCEHLTSQPTSQI